MWFFQLPLFLASERCLRRDKQLSKSSNLWYRYILHIHPSLSEIQLSDSMISNFPDDFKQGRTPQPSGPNQIILVWLSWLIWQWVDLRGRHICSQRSINQLLAGHQAIPSFSSPFLWSPFCIFMLHHFTECTAPVFLAFLEMRSPSCHSLQLCCKTIQNFRGFVDFCLQNVMPFEHFPKGLAPSLICLSFGGHITWLYCPSFVNSISTLHLSGNLWSPEANRRYGQNTARSWKASCFSAMPMAESSPSSWQHSPGVTWHISLPWD